MGNGWRLDPLHRSRLESYVSISPYGVLRLSQRAVEESGLRSCDHAEIWTRGTKVEIRRTSERVHASKLSLKVSGLISPKLGSRLMDRGLAPGRYTATCRAGVVRFDRNEAGGGV